MQDSECCQAELEKDFIIDQFHGCDDDYELKVPVYRCSKCKDVYLPAFSFHKKPIANES